MNSHGVYRIATGSLVLLLAVTVPVLVWHNRAFLAMALRRFFTEPGPAFNLSIVRIIYYSTALALLEGPTVPWHMARFPKSLIAAPIGVGWAIPLFPISSSLVLVSFFILIVTSVTAALGLYTRTSSVVFAIALFYYLTIPQLYGKVDHDHLVLWVAVLLATSSTADVWSIDAVRLSYRRPRRGAISIPPPSVAYSRPLRILWIFLGLTYVLPGIFKFKDTGLAWASPTNMRGILYEQWYQLGGYRPPISIDHAPLLFVMGVGTMFFETTFIIWLIFPKTRLLSPAMGVVFHTSTNIVMRIAFYSSMILYASFVNWEGISLRLLRRPGMAVLQIEYDAQSALATARAAAIQRLALPGAFATADVRELGSDKIRTAPNDEIGLRDLGSGETWTGVHAYRRIAPRAPGIWLVVALHWLAQQREARGSRIIGGRSLPKLAGQVDRRMGRAVAPTIFGVLIFFLSGIAAATGSVNAWPVAVYPTFAGDHSPWVTTSLEVWDEESGAVVDLQRCLAWLPEERFVGLLSSIISRPIVTRGVGVTGLLAVAQRGCPILARSPRVEVYVVTISTAPPDAGRVLDKTLISAGTDY